MGVTSPRSPDPGSISGKLRGPRWLPKHLLPLRLARDAWDFFRDSYRFMVLIQFMK